MRLNKTIKDQILTSLMNHRFGKQIKVLLNAKYDLAEAAYNCLYDQATRSRMSKLPDGWLPERTHMNVYVYGKRLYINLKKCRRFTNEHIASHDNIHIHDDAFNKQWESFVRDETALTELQESARGTIQGMLMSCSSTESLVKKWPEVAKFIPKEEAAISTTTALAIPISQLNQMLGLP